MSSRCDNDLLELLLELTESKSWAGAVQLGWEQRDRVDWQVWQVMFWHGVLTPQTYQTVAAYYNAHDVVQTLLQGWNLNVDAISEELGHQSPLMVVRDYGIAVKLVQAQADVNITNIFGESPLTTTCKNHFRLEKNTIEHSVLPLLLEHGAAINHCTSTGTNALIELCKHNAPQHVSLLLDKGIHIHKCDNEGRSGLYTASSEEHDAVVDVLLAQGDFSNETVVNAHVVILRKCTINEVDEGKSLLEKYTMSNGPQLVMLMARLNVQELEKMCQDGITLTDANGLIHSTPLHDILTSQLRDKERVFNMLCQAIPNTGILNEFKQTLLHIACSMNSKACFDTLISNEASRTKCDMYGRCIIHFWRASKSLDGIPIQSILAHVDIDAKDYNGHTALHLAVLKDDATTAEALIRNGSKIYAEDKNGITPITLCKLTSNTAVLQILKCDETKRSVSDQSSDVAIIQCVQEPVPVYLFRKRDPQLVQWLQDKLTDVMKEGVENHYLNVCKRNIITACWPADKLEEGRVCVREVLDLLADVGKEMKKIDLVMAFCPELAGSCREGTKIGKVDEADVVCLVPFFSGLLELGDHAEFDPEFVKVKLKACVSDETKQQIDSICTSDDFLVPSAFFRRFFYAFNQAISNKEIWKKHRRLSRVEVYDVCSTNQSIGTIELIWHGTIDKWQKISVDIVPTFDFSSKVPSKCKSHPLLVENGVYVIPKWTVALEAEHVKNMFQLSFNVSENQMFDIMPPAMKQGYCLAKAVVESCPVIEGIEISRCITSYIMKIAIFHVYETIHGQAVHDSAIDKTQILRSMVLEPIEDIMDWAKQIFTTIEKGLEQHKLDNFFLTDSNKLAHAFYHYDFRPLMYVRLCKSLLMHTTDVNKASKAVVQQTQVDSTLHRLWNELKSKLSIRNLFPDQHYKCFSEQECKQLIELMLYLDLIVKGKEKGCIDDLREECEKYSLPSDHWFHGLLKTKSDISDSDALPIQKVKACLPMFEKIESDKTYNSELVAISTEFLKLVDVSILPNLHMPLLQYHLCKAIETQHVVDIHRVDLEQYMGKCVTMFRMLDEMAGGDGYKCMDTLMYQVENRPKPATRGYNSRRDSKYQLLDKVIQDELLSESKSWDIDDLAGIVRQNYKVLQMIDSIKKEKMVFMMLPHAERFCSQVKSVGTLEG